MQKSDWKLVLSACFLVLILCSISIEHKYDKVFRYYSLTLVPPGLNITSGFDKKIYFYPSDLIAVVLFSWTLFRTKIQERSCYLFLGILGCAALSIAASPLSHYPLPYLRLLHLFTPCALFFWLTHNPLTKEHIFSLSSWTLLGVGLFQSTLALLQYFNQHLLGLRILSEHQGYSTIPSCDARRWVFDRWMDHPHHLQDSILRSMGTLPHANVLGGLLMLTLLMTTYLFCTHPKKRLWLAPVYFLQLFALATTYSRSALFGYCLANLIWFAWMKLRHGLFMKQTALLLACGTLTTGVLLHEQYVVRGGVVNYNEVSRGSDQERFHYQALALNMIKTHPWLGVGFGQFSLRAPDFLPQGSDPKFTRSAVHNIYLLLAAETGLIALALFLGWIALVLKKSWRTSSPEAGLLSAALLGYLLIGSCDFYLILFQQGKLLFFLTAGLVVCLTRSYQPNSLTSSQQKGQSLATD